MKKIALVTGSYQGIGRAIADLLKENGYICILSDVYESCEGNEYVKCDISNKNDRENSLNYVISKYGKLDLLVNNAGVACKNRLDILETTEESFDRLITVNLKGTFFMCQIYGRKMIELKKIIKDYNPRIVNISSVSAYTSSTLRGEYCISKAGISMTTKLFADRLAEFEIPVFEIRPGIIKTPMTACVSEKYDKLISEGVTPIRRWGQPEDVAKCVIAAASGLLDFGTGTILNADGGFHIQRL